MPAGRPTKYNDEMCDKVDKYLSECKSRDDLPTMARLAYELSVSKECLYEWGRVYPKFSDSLRKVVALQEDKLVQRGLKKEYDSTITKLMLSSNHGYTDKKEVLNTNVELKKEDLPTAKNEDLIKNLNESN